MWVLRAAVAVSVHFLGSVLSVSSAKFLGEFLVAILASPPVGRFL